MRRLLAVLSVLALGAMAGCGQVQQQKQVPQAAAHGHSAADTAPAAPLRSGERFLMLSMPRPFTPEPVAGTDEYRCFLLDPQLAASAFVTGSQFLPQNPELVHHAIFFRIAPDAVPEAQGLDERTPGDGWTCFGGTGVEGRGGPGAQLGGDAGWIAAWAPGGAETMLGKGIGYKLEPGSRIVMQIHYNLLASNGRPVGTDRSSIRLRIADGTAKLKALRTSLVPAPVELPCPPGHSGPLCDRETAILDVWHRFGAKSAALIAGLNLLCFPGGKEKPGSTQHCDIRVRHAGTVYAVAGHMHLLGRSIKVELNPGTPKAKVLLNVPVYDFDNQGARPLAKPVAIKPGDTFRVTCTHDATLRTKLPALQQLPPRYVVWGEGTSDEMCLGIVVWS